MLGRSLLNVILILRRLGCPLVLLIDRVVRQM